MSAAVQPLPVTLLSGFLGAGKTTLLEHILRNREGIRCALVVNDMAEINIDASLVKGTRLLQTQEKMVELHNGCICCTLREDLLVELRKLAMSGVFDVVVIESTGVSEPMQVAETFFMDPPDGGPKLNTVARLDNCITVVDASTFADNLRSVQSVSEKFGPVPVPCQPGSASLGAHATCDSDNDAAAAADDEEWEDDDAEEIEDDRNIAHLLVDQVEFANVVVINKADLVSQDLLAETKRLIAQLNPNAHVVVTQKSEVDLRALLFTSKFSEAFALKAKGWMAEIDANVKHNPETLEYGIGSFVYRSPTPFHPKRLYDVITRYFLLQEIDGAENGDDAAPGNTPVAVVGPEVDRKKLQATLAQRQKRRFKEWGNVLRSKGYVWLGTLDRMGGFGEWNHAGNVLSFGYAGGWGMFPDPNVDPLTNKAGNFATHFIEKTPGQEIVFIGQNLNREAITAALHQCLLTPAEEATLAEAGSAYEAQGGQAVLGRPCGPFEDPFERWAEDEPEDQDEAAEAAPAGDATQRRAAAAAAWGGTATATDGAARREADDEDDDDDDGAARKPRRGGGMK